MGEAPNKGRPEYGFISKYPLKIIGYGQPQNIKASGLYSPAGACLEILPEYEDALTNIHYHSHLWIISWQDKAEGLTLKTDLPLEENKKIIPTVFGSFAARGLNRPNSISLNLVKLEKAEKRLLFVSGLNIPENTPILDIKPYTEKDIIFSPKSPYIKGEDKKNIKEYLYKKAFLHHGEECSGMALGVQMAVKAEETFGDLQNPELTLKIKGSACLADTLQGLSKARFSNPPRFVYTGESPISSCIWRKGNLILQTNCLSPEFNKSNPREIMENQSDYLLHVEKIDLGSKNF